MSIKFWLIIQSLSEMPLISQNSSWPPNRYNFIVLENPIWSCMLLWHSSYFTLCSNYITLSLKYQCLSFIICKCLHGILHIVDTQKVCVKLNIFSNMLNSCLTMSQVLDFRHSSTDACHLCHYLPFRWHLNVHCAIAFLYSDLHPGRALEHSQPKTSTIDPWITWRLEAWTSCAVKNPYAIFVSPPILLIAECWLKSLPTTSVINQYLLCMSHILACQKSHDASLYRKTLKKWSCLFWPPNIIYYSLSIKG